MPSTRVLVPPPLPPVDAERIRLPSQAGARALLELLDELDPEVAADVKARLQRVAADHPALRDD